MSSSQASCLHRRLRTWFRHMPKDPTLGSCCKAQQLLRLVQSCCSLINTFHTFAKAGQEYQVSTEFSGSQPKPHCPVKPSSTTPGRFVRALSCPSAVSHFSLPLGGKPPKGAFWVLFIFACSPSRNDYHVFSHINHPDWLSRGEAFA